MRCALLTGARTEELFSIRVRDLKLTEAIPYIDLMELIERGAKGKGVGAWLSDDLREVPEGSIVERSQPVSKAFTRLRRRLGCVDEFDQAKAGSEADD